MTDLGLDHSIFMHWMVGSTPDSLSVSCHGMSAILTFLHSLESLMLDTSGSRVHMPKGSLDPNFRFVHRLDPSTGSRGTWLQIQEWIDVCNRHRDCGRFTIPHDNHPERSKMLETKSVHGNRPMKEILKSLTLHRLQWQTTFLISSYLLVSSTSEA